MNIWITADLHYNHKNLVKGCSEWKNKDACRNFETLEKHNETIVNNINKYVKENDIFYILGDFAMGGRDSVWIFRKKIKCKNIIFIEGNHDNAIHRNVILKTDEGFINAKNLFSQCHQVLEKKIHGKNFFMSHYSHRTWHKAHRGSIHLYGHSHGSLYEYGKGIGAFISPTGEVEYSDTELYKCMDVGIDTHPEFRPYHINEILKIMEKRQNLNIDHHEYKTGRL